VQLFESIKNHGFCFLNYFKMREAPVPILQKKSEFNDHPSPLFKKPL
jgi:hypothetical protein